MKKVYSAGGVVFKQNSILLLKKANGDWVLPKGKIEPGESKYDTALREVREESGVSAKTLDYIGSISYKFKNVWSHYKLIEKTVHWYIMVTEQDFCEPQREEGFIKATYFDMDKAQRLVRYVDERKMVRKAIDIYKDKYIQEYGEKI